jgi:hypothetical protein
MGKDFETLEINKTAIETISTEVDTLDELSLALVGGGKYVIAV